MAGLTSTDIISSPYHQTRFLGATITDFSAKLGFGTNSSEISVQLIEDDCNSTQKRTYNIVGDEHFEGGADSFQMPQMGEPLLFRYGGFEYGGVVTNVERSSSVSKKGYTVRLASPTVVLSNAQIILSGLDDAFPSSPNMINLHPSMAPPQKSWCNDVGVTWSHILSVIEGNTFYNRGFAYKLLVAGAVPGCELRFDGDTVDVMSAIDRAAKAQGLRIFVELSKQSELLGGSNFIKIHSDSGQGGPSIARASAPGANDINSIGGGSAEQRLSKGSIYRELSSGSLGYSSTTGCATSGKLIDVNYGIEASDSTTHAMINGEFKQQLFHIKYEDIKFWFGVDKDDGLPVTRIGEDKCKKGKLYPHSQYPSVDFGGIIKVGILGEAFYEALQKGASYTADAEMSPWKGISTNPELHRDNEDNVKYSTDSVNEISGGNADYTDDDDPKGGFSWTDPDAAQKSPKNPKLFITDLELRAAEESYESWRAYMCFFFPQFVQGILLGDEPDKFEMSKIFSFRINFDKIFRIINRHVPPAKPTSAYVSEQNNANTSVKGFLKMQIADNDSEDVLKAIHQFVSTFGQYYGKQYACVLPTKDTIDPSDGTKIKGIRCCPSIAEPPNILRNYELCDGGWPIHEGGKILGLGFSGKNAIGIETFKSEDNKVMSFTKYDAARTSSTYNVPNASRLETEWWWTGPDKKQIMECEEDDAMPDGWEKAGSNFADGRSHPLPQHDGTSGSENCPSGWEASPMATTNPDTGEAEADTWEAEDTDFPGAAFLGQPRQACWPEEGNNASDTCDEYFYLASAQVEMIPYKNDVTLLDAENNLTDDEIDAGETPEATSMGFQETRGHGKTCVESSEAQVHAVIIQISGGLREMRDPELKNDIVYLDSNALTYELMKACGDDKRKLYPLTPDKKTEDKDKAPIDGVFGSKEKQSLRELLLQNTRFRNLGLSTKAMDPDEAVISLKSRDNCYGPYEKNSGTSGKSEYERDTNLSPWNWGSSVAMNAAGQARVNLKTSGKAVQESGSAKLVGLPTDAGVPGLGSSLGGAPCTDVSFNLSVGGVTTSLTFRTFIRSFGDLAQSKLEFLELMNKAQQKFQKAFKTSALERAQRNLLKRFSDVGGGGGGSGKIADKQATASAGKESGTKFGEEAHTEIIRGGIGAFHSEITHDAPGVTEKDFTVDNEFEANYPTHGRVTTLSAESFETTINTVTEDAWLNQGGVGWEGIFRPFQITDQGGDLTIYDFGSPPCSVCPTSSTFNSGLDTSYAICCSPAPETSPSCEVIQITSKTANPFMTITDAIPLAHKIEEKYKHGNDIRNVFWGDKPLEQEHPLAGFSTEPEKIRPVGLRGPVVIVGWGYDTNGSPVPADEKEPCKFEDDWLVQPDLWKAGPLDVRWDDCKKMWVPPPPEVKQRNIIVYAKLEGDLDPGGTEKASPQGDGGGESFVVTNRLGQPLCKGQHIFAYYNPDGCEWVVMQAEFMPICVVTDMRAYAASSSPCPAALDLTATTRIIYTQTPPTVGLETRWAQVSACSSGIPGGGGGVVIGSPGTVTGRADPCDNATFDWTSIPGYNATKSQILGHDANQSGTCPVKWMDVANC